jgi:hypothetical protein
MAEERNDTAGWIELDLKKLQPSDETQIPFQAFANRFKSSSPDSENFIHDPLGELIAAGERGVDAFKQIDEKWTVSTFIVNHEDGLRFVHLYAVAKVIPGKKKVAITMVKLTQEAP